jgi:hypothetical protein
VRGAYEDETMRKYAIWAAAWLLVACGGSGTEPKDDAGPDVTEVCVPSAGLDVPDRDFIDSNCDGIDGDVASSLFVATNGSDSSDGTIDSPFKTVQHAIETAAQQGVAHILISAGTYSELLTFPADVSGIHLHGGYNRESGWSRSTSNIVTFASGGVRSLTAERISDCSLNLLRFVSADAAADDSSIAVVLKEVDGVDLWKVDIVAGNGGTGSDGTTPTTARQPGDDGTTGGIASAHNAPGLDSTVTRNGGSGGAARCSCGAGASGANAFAFNSGGTMVIGNGARGSAGRWLENGTCGSTAGTAGQNGPAGANGNIGEGGLSLGGFDVSALSYVPSDGTSGTDGFSGEGGRGGSGGGGGVHCSSDSPERVLIPARGGGGGSGGCGGLGGTAGNGGGASIALLSVDSMNVTLEDCAFKTGTGGSGGAGGLGQAGASGGIGQSGGAATQLTCNAGGSVPVNFAAGGKGGNGGQGGQGGQGGGGGGGPSIGIVYVGTQPVVDDSVTFDLGSGGAGGTSDAPGATGESLELYEVTL